MRCVVKGCKSYDNARKLGISFHRIPLDEDVKKIWAEKIDVPFTQFIPRDRICSIHFDDSDYNEHLSRRVLKSKAVPSKELPIPNSKNNNFSPDNSVRSGDIIDNNNRIIESNKTRQYEICTNMSPQILQSEESNSETPQRTAEIEFCSCTTLEPELNTENTFLNFNNMTVYKIVEVKPELNNENTIVISNKMEHYETIDPKQESAIENEVETPEDNLVHKNAERKRKISLKEALASTNDFESTSDTDADIMELEEPKSHTEEVKVLRNYVIKARKRIKHMQQNIRRKSHKIAKLCFVLTELRDMDLVSDEIIRELKIKHGLSKKK